MSYEKIREDKKVCDCGKGFFVTEIWENDWMQRREEKRIDCPVCKEFFYYRNQELRRIPEKVLKDQKEKPGAYFEYVDSRKDKKEFNWNSKLKVISEKPKTV